MEFCIEPLSNLQQDVKNCIYKAQLNFKTSSKEKNTLAYVETRLEYLEDQWKSFTDTHRTILTDVNPSDYLSSSYYIDNMYESTLELYCDYKTELKESLSNISEKQSKNNSTDCNNIRSSGQTIVGIVSQVKLPKIVIPVFNGQYEEWPSFKDLFESLIHNNPNLDSVQKLHYLKTHLAGEAEQLLRHVSITAANYDKAWALLHRRFSNKKYLSNCLLQRLIYQPTISRESAKDIKNLLDTTLDCLNGLEGQGINIDTWDSIIIFIISSKLDYESRKLWEAEVGNTSNYPTLTQFVKFLELRFRSLEFLITKPLKTNPIPKTVNSFHTSTVSCLFCAKSHRLYNCKLFSSESTDSRRSFAKVNSLCFNCLVPGHSAFLCKRFSRCRICKKKHHSLLHSRSSFSQPKPNNIENTSTKSHTLATENKSSVQNNSNSTANTQVILPTAVVKVKRQTGKYLNLRSLLDQGSQASFITESAVQSLGLRKRRTYTSISGVGDKRDNVSNSMVTFRIHSIYDPNFSTTVRAHVLNKLTSVTPSQTLNTPPLPYIENLELADPFFYMPNKVDLLLGADVYSQVLAEGLHKGPPGTPIAQNTMFGWVLSG